MEQLGSTGSISPPAGDHDQWTGMGLTVGYDVSKVLAQCLSLTILPGSLPGPSGCRSRLSYCVPTT